MSRLLRLVVLLSTSMNIVTHSLLLPPQTMETLVDNARYVGDEKPSPCQLQCKPFQTTIASCLESTRATGDNACLAPAVQAWTKCCREANVGAGEGD